MRNIHQIILEDNGMEALQLFRQWERLQLRTVTTKTIECGCRRCIHKELVPVSIRLKTHFKDR